MTVMNSLSNLTLIERMASIYHRKQIGVFGTFTHFIGIEFLLFLHVIDSCVLVILGYIILIHK